MSFRRTTTRNISKRKKLAALPILAALSLSACHHDEEDNNEDNTAGQKSGAVDQFSVLAFVENLEGTGLVLQINGGDDTSPDTNGNLTFPNKLDDGSTYSVTIASQPSSPAQDCAVKAGTGSGTIIGADVSDVRIQCETTAVALSFSDSTPTANEKNVAVDASIELNFSANLDHTTVTNTSVSVMGPDGEVSGQLDISENSVTFTPDEALTSLSQYTITTSSAIEDLQGNALAEDKSISFTTEINTNKWYRLTNKLLGEDKSLDTSNPDYDCAMGDSGPYTGQYWRFTPAEKEGYYIMQTHFSGERQALEGGNAVDACLFTGFADKGAPFSGQLWKVTPTSDGYFRVQSNFKGDGYSLDADPQPQLAETTDNDDQQWKLTEISDVPAVSLNQFVYVAGTASYQYGASNVIPNLDIANAPADIDFSRWAMLGGTDGYQMYVFKRHTNDTLYQFTYNAATQKYEMGVGGLSETVSVTGAPDDANKGSIAMVYAQSAKRLYMRSSTSNAVYQFKFNQSTNAFEYAANGAIAKIDVTGSPNDTDWSRWAMLHDGTNFRIYAMKSGTNNQIYQFAYNSASGDYEYGFNSIDLLTIEQIPVGSDRMSFAMLFQGDKYRLYMLNR